ncbi:MAG TPA: lysylphosphatidylglycerol synthase transmembrane domain-containing protein [Candidatus Moranbacteria bacterium]|nr:lysylphosphatidylglycerol synthase transmembrane domain-containing protein [Candidatus Moranbacteria bacterium]
MKYLKLVLKIAVSAAFVVWLVRKTDWAAVSSYVLAAKAGYVAAYFFLLFGGMLISARKWKMLLSHKGLKLETWECFKLYLSGALINNFMPSTIGGDAYRAYKAAGKDKKIAAALSSVVVDRLSGLLGAMLVAVFFALWQWEQISANPPLAWTVRAVLMVMHAFIFLGILVRTRLWRKISGFFPQSIRKIGAEFASYKDGGVFSRALLWSVAFSLVGLGALNYVLFLALGIPVGVGEFLAVIFLISIVSALPVSINNIGIKEWAYVTFFGFFGVNAAAVTAVAITSRALQMIFSLLALPEYIRGKGK